MPKAPHHQGSYGRDSAAVVAAANTNPHTRCWRCGRTLAEHPTHRNGRPPRWTAGHVNPGEIGGLLLPEASTCNYTHGARLGGLRRAAKMRARRLPPHLRW